MNFTTSCNRLRNSERVCQHLPLSANRSLEPDTKSRTSQKPSATMADPTTSTNSPLREVQIEALVVMRIIKHSTSAFPTPATGCLVGMTSQHPPAPHPKSPTASPSRPQYPSKQINKTNSTIKPILPPSLQPPREQNPMLPTRTR